MPSSQCDAGTVGELLNHLSNGDALALGSRPYQCDGGEECVPPVVVGVPPCHLVEQARFQAAPHRCTCGGSHTVSCGCSCPGTRIQVGRSPASLHTGSSRFVWRPQPRERRRRDPRTPRPETCCASDGDQRPMLSIRIRHHPRPDHPTAVGALHPDPLQLDVAEPCHESTAPGTTDTAS